MAAKLAMGGGLAVLFAITVLILMRVLPGPHKPTDYLVMGGLATFVCLLFLFVVNLITSGDDKEVFFKRRR